MSEKIECKIEVRANFLSEISLIPKSDIGIEESFSKDYYNVFHIIETDENGVDFLIIRTRYYFYSPQDTYNFLHFFFESNVYFDPPLGTILFEFDNVVSMFQMHDQLAHQNFSQLTIDPNQFPGFGRNTMIQYLNYEYHAKLFMKERFGIE